MDGFTPEQSRYLCALLTGVLAALVAAGMRPAWRQRAVLLLVMAAAVANILLLAERRSTHSNLGHYYIGAKYPGAYESFYNFILAGRGEPQVAYRDLRTHVMVRRDPREHRLYFIGLLTNAGVAVRGEASLKELEDLCRTSGALGREADEILRHRVDPPRVPELRADLERVKVDANDYGFNGSPFYALLRKADPSLHRGFGPAVFWINLVWQLAALAGAVWMAARALQWRAGWAAGVLALALASWDYAGWGLNGLVVAGWLLPAIAAVYGMARGNPWLAGVGIAWAGLVKLFPFILLMPVGALMVQELMRLGAGRSDAEGRGRLAWCLKVVFACGAAALLFGVAGSASGYSWNEFLGKIGAQIGGADYPPNAVGLPHILASLGVRSTPVLLVPQLTMFFALAWVCWMREPREALARMPQAAVLLLGSLCWLTVCFNYYYLAALFLVPMVAQERPGRAAWLVALFALSCALPEFGRADASVARYAAVLKTLPYLVLPLMALAIATRDVEAQARPGTDDRVSSWFYRRRCQVVLCGTVLSAVALVAEVYRVNATAYELRAGALALQQQRLGEAREAYARAARLSPGRWDAHFGLGCALDAQGDFDGASEAYFSALERNPAAVPALNNLAILYLRRGRSDVALAAWEEVVKAVPYDEEGRVNLAQALAEAGRTNEAVGHLKTALLIDPAMPAAKDALARLGVSP